MKWVRLTDDPIHTSVVTQVKQDPQPLPEIYRKQEGEDGDDTQDSPRRLPLATSWNGNYDPTPWAVGRPHTCSVRALDARSVEAVPRWAEKTSTAVSRPAIVSLDTALLSQYEGRYRPAPDREWQVARREGHLLAYELGGAF
jgi:hypothetical protein